VTRNAATLDKASVAPRLRRHSDDDAGSSDHEIVGGWASPRITDSSTPRMSYGAPVEPVMTLSRSSALLPSYVRMPLTMWPSVSTTVLATTACSVPVTNTPTRDRSSRMRRP